MTQRDQGGAGCYSEWPDSVGLRVVGGGWLGETVLGGDRQMLRYLEDLVVA
jgi:hypothetical protein